MAINSFPIPTRVVNLQALDQSVADAIAAANRAEVARDDAQGVLPDRLRRDLPTLLADNTLTYTAGQPGTVAPDDIIRTRAEGFSYKVAPIDATDQHVTTAGGVKLYVLPDGERYTAIAFSAACDGATDDTAAITLIEALSDDLEIYLPGDTVVTVVMPVKKYIGPGRLIVNGDIHFRREHLVVFDAGEAPRTTVPNIGSRFGQLKARLLPNGLVDEQHVLGQIAAVHLPADYATFDPANLAAGDYLVAPDGNNTDGLTWATAYQTVGTARLRSDVRRIGVKGGLYLTDNGIVGTDLNAWGSANDLSIYGINQDGTPADVYFARAVAQVGNWRTSGAATLFRFFLPDNGYSSPDWAQEYANFGIIDFEELDDAGNPYLYELDQEAQSSGSTFSLKTGHYFVDFLGNLWINRRNGKLGLPSRTGVLLFEKGFVRAGRADRRLYMRNCWFIGGLRPDGGNDATRICMDQGGIVGRRDRDGCQVLAVGGFIALGTQNYGSAKDGYNYTAFNGVIPHGLEVNVNSYNHKFNTNINGPLSGTANASTAHTACIVTRLGGEYWDCRGPIVADVNAGTKSYNWKNKIHSPISTNFLFQMQDGEGFLIEPELGATDGVQVYFDNEATGHVRGRIASMRVETTASVSVE